MHRGFVVKLTGKLFELENVDKLIKISEVFREYQSKYRIAIVCGGGKTLRRWLEYLRKDSETSEYELDLLGIKFTRLNAEILKLFLRPNVHDRIPESLEEAIDLLKTSRKILVLGGLSPGFSTNAVAAFIAKELGYSLINMTSAGGVYNKDPSKYDDAVKLSKISIDDLIKMLSTQYEHAGSYPLFDRTSLNIIRNYRISTYVIGPDHRQLKAVFDGEEAGTKIIV